MQTREAIPREPVSERETLDLQQQVRSLQDRLAFYEGFDLLIQDNVAHARELFRLAAQERESASTATDRVRRDARQRETYLRAELETIASDLNDLARAVDALTHRIARALGDPLSAKGRMDPLDLGLAQAVAVVVHGVPSARTALSLQRFVATLPQVAEVSAREFVGGVLRLDARVRDRLQFDHFLSWDNSQRILPLTERPDVIEFALQDPDLAISTG